MKNKLEEHLVNIIGEDKYIRLNDITIKSLTDKFNSIDESVDNDLSSYDKNSYEISYIAQDKNDKNTLYLKLESNIYDKMPYIIPGTINGYSISSIVFLRIICNNKDNLKFIKSIGGDDYGYTINNILKIIKKTISNSYTIMPIDINDFDKETTKIDKIVQNTHILSLEEMDCLGGYFISHYASFITQLKSLFTDYSPVIFRIERKTIGIDIIIH